MKRHRYRVTLEHLSDAREGSVHRVPLQFEVEDRDDIIAVVAWLRDRGDFSDPGTAAAFGVGLKLFGGVLLANRDDPLFSALLQHLYQFVKALKAGAREG